MSMTDPIADLFTRIRNAHMAKHDRLDVPASKLKVELCRLLKDEGYIKSFRVLERQPTDMLRVFLRYTPEGDPAIQTLRRVSRPGRRVYMKAEQVRPVLNGLGLGIISTSQGLLSDTQARDRRVGGEVLCEVW